MEDVSVDGTLTSVFLDGTLVDGIFRMSLRMVPLGCALEAVPEDGTLVDGT